MIRKFTDLKFAVTIIATIAGVFVPVWLWQADLRSKSLSIELISRISLQPLDKKSLPGMEVSIDGTRLANPYLTVFRVLNDGSKPIPTADFEKMVEIRLASETSFSRVRISAKSPNDLEPEIVTEKQKISLKPTLLNPKDTIEITAITSGADPVYSSKVRIVGIPSVTLMDSTKNVGDKKSIVPMSVISVLLFIAGMISFNGMALKQKMYLRPRAALFCCISVLSAGSISLLLLLNTLGNDKFWVYLLSTFGMMIICGLVASIVNRKIPEIDTDDGCSQKEKVESQ